MNLKHSLTAAFAATLCASASASTTTYAFTGRIATNNTVNPIRTFSTFSGQFSFDPARPDLAPADPGEGYYPMVSALYGMHVVFDDGTVFDTDPMAGYGLTVHLPIAGPVGTPPDTARFDVFGSVAGQTNRFMSLNFVGGFTTDAIPFPAGGFDVGFFDSATFSYHGLPDAAPLPGAPPVVAFGAFGPLTSLACIAGCVSVTEVPEPGSMALMLAGLTAAGVGVRRRRPVA